MRIIQFKQKVLKYIKIRRKEKFINFYGKFTNNKYIKELINRHLKANKIKQVVGIINIHSF